jgi:membrane-bound ClpP family serine protease
MRVGPSTAFLIFVFGIFLIYVECLRPGRVLPGLLGSVMTIAGGYWLWRNSPTIPGTLLIILAALLLITETLWDMYFIPGILGTISLGAGFSLLFSPGRRITPSIAIPISIALGAFTTFLAFEAKRARRNKRSDL